jgi:dethiobiotin synthetase
MIDYKNYKSEEKYPMILIVRDGLGTLALAILGYVSTVFMWS